MMDEEYKKAIVKYRLEKSDELLKEVRLLIDNGFANASVSRMYYACYHVISALLFSHNIETKTHKGLRQQFGLNFVRNNLIDIKIARIFTIIADKREESDYDDFVRFSLEKVNEYFVDVKEFVEAVRKLVRLD